MSSIDLHCHSYISDGALSPRDLILLAHQQEACMIALTDHDQIDGLNEARKTASELGITFINGVEISVTWRHKTIHIVGLNFTPSENMRQVLAENRSGRLQRLAQMAERLEKRGKITGVYEGALALVNHPDSVSRTHVAQYLVACGAVRNTNHAFKKWLGDGKPACVPHQWIGLNDAVQLIKNHNGIAVLAHPARYRLSATINRLLIEEFIAAGGEAVEVGSSTHNLSEQLRWAELAHQYQLLSSVGSDFHGNGEFGRHLGKTPDLPSICTPVWTVFK